MVDSIDDRVNILIQAANCFIRLAELINFSKYKISNLVS
jgi:hypothetical protein